MRSMLVLIGLPLILSTGCVSWWEHRELGDRYRELSIVVEDSVREARNSHASTAVIEAELAGCQARNKILAEEIAALQASLADARGEIARKYEVAAASVGDLDAFRGIEGVSVSEQGAIVLEDSIFFASGSHDLKQAGQRSLGRVVQLLGEARYAGYDILVAGHTDTDPIRRTADRYEDNWDLGFNRAWAVGTFMIQQGIPGARLGLASYGPNRPVSESKAKNRRVEIVLVRRDVVGADRF